MFSQVPLKIEPNTTAWSKSEIDKAVEMEAQMANQVGKDRPAHLEETLQARVF